MTIAHLATTTLAVSLLIVIVLALRGPVARRYGANMAYALWLLPAVRLVMPPLPAPVLPGLSWPGVLAPSPSGTAVEGAGMSAPAAPAQPGPAALPAPSPAAEAGVAGPGPQMPADTAGLATAGWLEGLPLGMIVVTGILAVAAIFHAVQLARQARFARLVAMEADPASPALARLSGTIARELGVRRAVAVKTSFLTASPMVMGALRPTVIVPAWFELDYTQGEQRLALTHELAHVKRGDLFALHAAQVLLALQWFNPLAHLALRAFRADQEAACDAAVLARAGTSPQAYGATLLKAVRLMRPAPQLQAAGLTLDHGLKERFRRMGWEGGRLSHAGKALGLALGGLLILASASTVAADEDDLLGGREQVEVLRSEDGARVVRIDRRERMIIAGDPFEDMQSELARLDGIGGGMTAPGAVAAPPVPPVPPAAGVHLNLDFGDLDGKLALDGLAGLAALGELGRLGELGALGALGAGDFKITASPDGQVLTLTGEGVHLTIDGFDAAAFEAGMEAFETRMASFEAEMEAYAEAIEAEAERHAAEIEARVAAVVDGPALERASEDGEAVIEDLSEKCEEELAGGAEATVVESRAPHSGKTFRAICMDDVRAMSDAEFEAFLAGHPELTEAERAAFRNQR